MLYKSYQIVYTNLNMKISKPVLLIFSAYFFSLLGDSLFKIAFPLFIYKLTKNAFYTALAYATQFLPYLFIMGAYHALYGWACGPPFQKTPPARHRRPLWFGHGFTRILWFFGCKAQHYRAAAVCFPVFCGDSGYGEPPRLSRLCTAPCARRLLAENQQRHGNYVECACSAGSIARRGNSRANRRYSGVLDKRLYRLRSRLC